MAQEKGNLRAKEKEQPASKISLAAQLCGYLPIRDPSRTRFRSAAPKDQLSPIARIDSSH